MILAALSLSVMTFNIRFATANDGENSWPYRRAALMKQLKQEAPAILGLQEALHSQIGEISTELGYASFGVGRDDGVRAGEFSPILYKPERFGILEGGTFWFSDTPEVIASKHWGNNITRVCTYARFVDKPSGRTFWVYNLHLDHQSQPSREKSVQLLLKRIDSRIPKSPVLVMGDFNAGEDNLAVKSMLTGGFKDSFRVLNPDAKEVGTFTAFEKPGVDKIDHIFSSPEWTVRSSAILTQKFDGRFTSDHFPVVATVELH